MVLERKVLERLEQVKRLELEKRPPLLMMEPVKLSSLVSPSHSDSTQAQADNVAVGDVGSSVESTFGDATSAIDSIAGEATSGLASLTGAAGSVAASATSGAASVASNASSRVSGLASSASGAVASASGRVSSVKSSASGTASSYVPLTHLRDSALMFNRASSAATSGNGAGALALPSGTTFSAIIGLVGVVAGAGAVFA